MIARTKDYQGNTVEIDIKRWHVESIANDGSTFRIDPTEDGNGLKVHLSNTPFEKHDQIHVLSKFTNGIEIR